jgi:RNA polymerase sigma-70 factor, ECF subfamily
MNLRSEGENKPDGGCAMKKSGEDQQVKDHAERMLDSARNSAARRQDGSGDFPTVLDTYAGVVYWLAEYVTGDSKDAEEVLQKTFLTARSGFTDSQKNESAVMRVMRTAINESFAKLRHRDASNLLRLSLEAEANATFVPREVVDWSDHAETCFTSEELRGMVHEGVQNLTPFSRVVFLLRDVASLRPEEIANLFHVSVPLVKSHLLRSRLQLREHLTAYFKHDIKEKARIA